MTTVERYKVFISFFIDKKYHTSHARFFLRKIAPLVPGASHLNSSFGVAKNIALRARFFEEKYSISVLIN